MALSVHPTPIYRTRRTRYEIDRCIPQVRAVREGKIRLQALSQSHYPGTPLGPRVLPGLNSIGHWDAARPQDWGLDFHRNEGIEITFLETGTLAFTVDRQSFDLHAGQFTVTRPWQLHKLGAPHIGPGRLHWLILDVGVRRPNQEWRWPAWLVLTPADLAELAHKLRHGSRPIWTCPAGMAACFRGMADCVQHWGQPHVESRLTTLLNQLFLQLLLAVNEQHRDDDPALSARQHTVALFLRDLADNPDSSREPWTLPRMAAQCGMGVTSFSQHCRELVNTGAVEYLNQCRLDHAARDLRREPTRSITDLAFAHGFNSSQYFATLFRRRFRTTPRDYRMR